MNKAEILNVIFEALKDSKNGDHIFKFLDIAPESRLRVPQNLMQDALIDVAMLVSGDNDEWINWYVYDNDLGRKALLAGKPGSLKPITNAKELLEIIND
jgi:hypothetical protein